jgi:hypothetical protein
VETVSSDFRAEKYYLNTLSTISSPELPASRREKTTGCRTPSNAFWLVRATLTRARFRDFSEGFALRPPLPFRRMRARARR